MSNLSNVDNIDGVKELNELLGAYKTLLENQAGERDILLRKVDEITKASESVTHIDNKMDNLVKLLLDIKKQVMAISSDGSKRSQNENMDVDHDTINQVASEVQVQGEELVAEISNLKQKIGRTEDEIENKDLFINELNEQLEQLAFEKSQLITKLESLSSLTERWNEEIDLLQKLAVSDPRYKAIDTLKKHGSLSEIQLAFSMGTSISQVKRYAEDLIKLNMIHRDSSGRYVWVGENS